MAMVIKWEESSVQGIIHYFTTTIVSKNPSGVLSSCPLSTTHMYSKTPSALNNVYSIHLRTKTMKEAVPAVQMANQGRRRLHASCKVR